MNMSQPNDNTLKVEGVEDYKSIFDGDGKIYQTVQQFIDEGGYDTGDNHTLRDPHYIEDNGHKYLVLKLTQEQKMAIKAKTLYITEHTTEETILSSNLKKRKLLEGSNKEKASLANGALGIIELNDDYTLEKSNEAAYYIKHSYRRN